MLSPFPHHPGARGKGSPCSCTKRLLCGFHDPAANKHAVVELPALSLGERFPGCVRRLRKGDAGSGEEPDAQSSADAPPAPCQRLLDDERGPGAGVTAGLTLDGPTIIYV